MRHYILSAKQALCLATLLPGLLLTRSAAAHHPTGSLVPTNFSDGLLSGLAHPIIGLDHLAFIVAIGVAAGISRFGAALPVLFVVASTAGVALHLSKFALPAVEPLVAISVILAGALLAGPRMRSSAVWIGLLAAAGIAHGYAHGETVAGAERPAVVAYVLGLALTQGGLMTGIAALSSRSSDARLTSRLAGAAVFVLGLVTLATGAIAG